MQSDCKSNKFCQPTKTKTKNFQINENKEKLALLIPVGTGAGGTVEAADSLAYGLLYLIKENNPDRIVFFTTELSNKTTLKSLKEQYFDELPGLQWHKYGTGGNVVYLNMG